VPNLKDLRAHPRYEKQLEVVVARSDAEVTGRTRNLSIGGLCIETDADFKVGEQVQIRLSIPSLPEHVRPEAVVRWIEEGPDDLSVVGMRFGSVDGAGISVLPAMWLWALNRFLADVASDERESELPDEPLRDEKKPAIAEID